MLYENPGHGTILIVPEVLSVFVKYRQTNPGSSEAGGYLLGQLFGDQLVIQIATEPSVADVRKRAYFKRDKRMGQEAISKYWRESKGRIALAGEWHTHPEPHPAPSPLDIQQASESIKKGHFPFGFMVLVIVSNLAVVNSWVGVRNEGEMIRLKRIGYRLWRDDR